MTSANAIVELMKIPVEEHDLAWLKHSLQAAVQLEFATIPPYLTAYWSIKDLDGDVASTIVGIAIDEMRHMGLVCNLLTGIGETPKIATPEVVPSYPGYLPGGVHPDLLVALSGLSRKTAELFTLIELPKKPLAAVETFPTIGEFYDAVLNAFVTLDPPLSDARQVAKPGFGLMKITTLDMAKDSLELIKHQGEGSADSPASTDPSALAHYYLFKEIATGRRLVKDATTGEFSFDGADVPLPDCFPMAEVPIGGYQKADVTPDVWDMLDAFDQAFTTMLKKLESAWSGTASDLSVSVSNMHKLTGIAVPLVQKPIPGGTGNYGPCFRLIIA
jgi:Ferritin-like